ncbi:MAG: hypothetical protein HY901_01205 [Deltaproteobacteria bacterium]|nr:hypothetical protein [Deltaproteobacteria bacterium]
MDGSAGAGFFDASGGEGGPDAGVALGEVDASLVGDAGADASSHADGSAADAAWGDAGPACFDGCGPEGRVECVGTDDDRICADEDGDGCLEWSAPRSCRSAACERGVCGGASLFARTYQVHVLDGPRSVEATADEGMIVAGRTSYSKAWLLKLTSAGAIQWQKSLASPDSAEASFSSVAQAANGGYCAVGTARMNLPWLDELLVAKFASNGDLEWARSIGGGGEDRGSSVLPTPEGGWLVAGQTASFGLCGPSGCPGTHFDLWVLKLSAIGDIEWQLTFGGDGDEEDARLVRTDQGDHYLYGNTTSFAPGGLGMLVLRIAAQGQVTWQRAYGPTYVSGEALRQTATGNVLVAGFAGEIFSFAPTGALLWQKSYFLAPFVSGSNRYLRSLRAFPSGGFVALGTTECCGADPLVHLWALGGADDGSVLWSRTYAGPYRDSAQALAIGSNEELLLAGTTQASPPASVAAWILRASPEGALSGACGPGVGASSSTQEQDLTSIQVAVPSVTVLVSSASSVIANLTISDTATQTQDQCTP